MPTPTGSQAELLEGIAAAIEQLAGAGVAAIGFGIPSVIDRAAGPSLGSVNIPLEDVSLGSVMGERFGVPVAVENDANVAALAEWRLGAGRGRKNLVMLTLGTGVGGGLVLGGALYAAGPSSVTSSSSRTARRARAPAPAAAISRPSRRGTPPTRRREALGRGATAELLVGARRRATRRRSRRSPGSAICSASGSGRSSTSSSRSS